MGDLVPRQTMVKQAMLGIGGIGGGIACFLLGGLPWIPGIIIGGIIVAIGLALSSNKKDKTAGLLTLGAGALVVLSKIPIPIFQGLSGFIIGAAGVGLLIVGGLSIYKFIKNMNARK